MIKNEKFLKEMPLTKPKKRFYLSWESDFEGLTLSLNQVAQARTKAPTSLQKLLGN